jgi:hypothetical protein
MGWTRYRIQCTFASRNILIQIHNKPFIQFWQLIRNISTNPTQCTFPLIHKRSYVIFCIIPKTLKMVLASLFLQVYIKKGECPSPKQAQLNLVQWFSMTKDVQLNELVVWLPGVREKWHLGAMQVLGQWPHPYGEGQFTLPLLRLN